MTSSSVFKVNHEQISQITVSIVDFERINWRPNQCRSGDFTVNLEQILLIHMNISLWTLEMFLSAEKPI